VGLALLLIPASGTSPSLTLVYGGAVLTALGEGLRFWAVNHIGTISRTRSERLGPLIDSGPFGFVRNPLYIGNIAIWTGFALTAQLAWLAPVVLLLLALEYHAIVKWEEQLLESRMGAPYRDYVSRVPRWIPWSKIRGARTDGSAPAPSAVSSVRATLFSERGTLIAIAAGYVLLWLKARF
jgi:protein-S-isoprenylcysteine O-methyltransferase Ste14